MLPTLLIPGGQATKLRTCCRFPHKKEVQLLTPEVPLIGFFQNRSAEEAFPQHVASKLLLFPPKYSHEVAHIYCACAHYKSVPKGLNSSG